MPTTTLRHRKADAYAITMSVAASPPRYYAFLIADTLVASIYAANGTWFADRGTIPLPVEPPTAENGTLIQVSPSPGGREGDGRGGQGVRGRLDAATIGPGALAWRSTPNEITVWDIAANQVHTYQGTEAAYCSPPVYRNGQLFWIEFPDQEEEPDTNQATLTLRASPCDLSDPQTLATVVFSALVRSWNLGPAAKVAATSTSLLFESEWLDNINHEVNNAAGASFPFDLTEPQARDGARLDLAQGFAATDGTAIGLSTPSNTLRSLPPILGAPSEPRWPTTGAWALAEGFGLAFNAALSADGKTALLYGTSTEDAPTVIEAPSTATTGEPTRRTVVAPHPVHEIPPNLLFLMELP
jgi:hypothetical protein